MFGGGVAALIAANIVLLLISRLYITRLQDRIIKLEMRVRGAQLLSPQQQAALSRLSRPQIVALRFASDAELPALLERAEREHLTADQIKRAIKTGSPIWIEPRHLLKPGSGEMKQVFAAAALEAVLAAARRPPSNEDSHIDRRSSSLGGLRRSFDYQPVVKVCLHSTGDASPGAALLLISHKPSAIAFKPTAISHDS